MLTYPEPTALLAVGETVEKSHSSATRPGRTVVNRPSQGELHHLAKFIHWQKATLHALNV